MVRRRADQGYHIPHYEYCQNVLKKLCLASVTKQRDRLCLACDERKDNEGVCIQQDVMDEILNKITAADVIVMATPVYQTSISQKTKC